MKIGVVIERLRDLELELAEEYREIGQRHAADHDVYHQCESFAKTCEEHAASLAQQADRYGRTVEADGGGGGLGTLLERVRRAASSALGREPEAGLLLLRDLRNLFLAAEECSITWVMLGQAAQAARDDELLEAVTKCHEQTENQVKWFVTKIKTASPQALTVG
jgi:hypothetical protein